MPWMAEKTADIFNNGNSLSEYTVYFSVLWLGVNLFKILKKCNNKYETKIQKTLLINLLPPPTLVTLYLTPYVPTDVPNGMA